MFNLPNLILERFSFERSNENFRVKNLIILIIALLLYLLNNNLLHSLNWFFTFYFNDLLAIIVLLSFLNVVYPFKLTNLWIIIIVTILASFVWEYVALFIKSGSIFDYMDIISYFASMAIYLALLYFIEGKINTSF
ncbi:hypothetical protein [Methanobrevibacter olleyae]|uniref:Uncharacterized protein n=1 Tax=Methanobrevibacter olleyae TaxID=294671 RepID=A0A126R0I3_METOL|nr:hypothetical protein [Methanobrevibacter olleyae]AMK15811.1 hypothetical protein YLM1_1254 [Methanobrevibacter olleyae]SFL19700.1 hypothetical protein SAMN02910297_00179 [Methanobrevibacter olleyae]